LLARITPCLENGKTAFVDFLIDGQVGWGSTEYIIFRPKPPLPLEYGYYLARSEELRNHAIINMTGTSGRQRTPASCFDSYMISVPPTQLAEKFGEFAKSIMKKIKINDEENRTLANLRNTLLPKLISGEVSVM
jgi:type I restriction enzyme S subunit